MVSRPPAQTSQPSSINNEMDGDVCFGGEEIEQVDQSERQSLERPFCPSDFPFSVQERWMLSLTSLFLLTLLSVARSLTPSSTGVGTHQGLGLPPCSFRFIFGVDCPSCGMTTSWAFLTRADFVSAFHANPGGLLLGIFAFVMAVWMLVSSWKGYWWPFWCQARWVLACGIGIIAVTLLNWILKITA